MRSFRTNKRCSVNMLLPQSLSEMKPVFNFYTLGYCGSFAGNETVVTLEMRLQTRHLLCQITWLGQG
jgi:hypothetical protein